MIDTVQCNIYISVGSRIDTVLCRILDLQEQEQILSSVVFIYLQDPEYILSSEVFKCLQDQGQILSSVIFIYLQDPEQILSSEVFKCLQDQGQILSSVIFIYLQDLGQILSSVVFICLQDPGQILSSVVFIFLQDPGQILSSVLFMSIGSRIDTVQCSIYISTDQGLILSVTRQILDIKISKLFYTYFRCIPSFQSQMSGKGGEQVNLQVRNYQN